MSGEPVPISPREHNQLARVVGAVAWRIYRLTEVPTRVRIEPDPPLLERDSEAVLSIQIGNYQFYREWYLPMIFCMLPSLEPSSVADEVDAILQEWRTLSTACPSTPPRP